jgi:cytochrome c biogenesis factor
MNENRSVFALDGVTGMLIATLLLLSILAGLTVWGIGVQQNSADKFYQIENEQAIKMNSVDNAQHLDWSK